MNTLVHSRFDTTTIPAPAEPSLDDLLAPIFDVANSSSTLLASRHEVRLGTRNHNIPKFLLLGQRGGGKPIRVGLFAGLDAGSVETVVALTRLLIQHELSPALARDYALFAYPVVNLRGFEQPSLSWHEFEAYSAATPTAPDAQFFQAELEGWNFDGLISLRVDPNSTGFHATTRSEVLGREVIIPALQAIESKFPVSHAPVESRPARLTNHAQGKFIAPVGTRPKPFEFELFAPGTLPAEQQITGLFLVVQELLRNYRRLISHAQNI